MVAVAVAVVVAGGVVAAVVFLTVIALSDPYASKRCVAGERRGGLVRHAAEHSGGDAAEENGLKPPTQPAGGLLMVPRPKPPTPPDNRIRKLCLLVR